MKKTVLSLAITGILASGPVWAVNLDGIDFAYDRSGDAKLMPAQVFNNGRQTYLQIRPGQPTPAIFAEFSGRVVPVQFKSEAPYLVLDGVPSAMVLVMEDRQVRVARLSAGGISDAGSAVFSPAANPVEVYGVAGTKAAAPVAVPPVVAAAPAPAPAVRPVPATQAVPPAPSTFDPVALTEVGVPAAGGRPVAPPAKPVTYAYVAPQPISVPLPAESAAPSRPAAASPGITPVAASESAPAAAIPKSTVRNYQVAFSGKDMAPTKADREMLAAIASRAGERSEIVIKGYSPARSDAARAGHANDRAHSVKRALVELGVAEDRIRVVEVRQGKAKRTEPRAEIFVRTYKMAEPAVRVAQANAVPAAQSDAPKPLVQSVAQRPAMQTDVPRREAAAASPLQGAELVKKGQGGRLTVNWSGDVEPLLRQVAHEAGLLFSVDGLAPVQPRIHLSMANVPAQTVIDLIGYQIEGAAIEKGARGVTLRYPIVHLVSGSGRTGQLQARWSGDATELIKAIADRAGLKYVGAIGDAVPLSIRIEQEASLMELLGKVGEAIDSKADLILRGDQIMIRYKKGNA